MRDIYVEPEGCIIITGGTISYAGPMKGKPAVRPDEHYDTIDAKGNVALPGFVDSHTHLIFGGFRPDEFEWRLKGIHTCRSWSVAAAYSQLSTPLATHRKRNSRKRLNGLSTE